MSDIWNEKNTVCWSPTKFIKEMNKQQARNAELEAELAELREAILDSAHGHTELCKEMNFAGSCICGFRTLAALLGEQR